MKNFFIFPAGPLLPPSDGADANAAPLPAWHRRWRAGFLLLLLGWFGFPGGVQAVEPGEALPPPSAIRLAPFAAGLEAPTSFACEGSGRLFVTEQKGRIQEIVEQRPRLFLDLSERVASGGECGLLGLAFHPRFAENGFFYVNYTTRRNGRLETVVSRFTADPRAVPSARSATTVAGTEKEILIFPQPYANHNGGQIAFGPDGMLYIGTGDGGSAGDPLGNGQNLGTWLGKILRIDVGRLPYRVPPDNPFLTREGARPEIWAYGLRNPWRFSFDRKTGELWVGDVGQNRWEEIDVVEKGGNYGWSAREGAHPFKPERADGAVLVEPVKDYGRQEGQSVIGGFVYRGRAFPALEGIYFYADFGSRHLWGLRREKGRITFDARLLTAPFPVSAFGEDAQGELYLLDYEGGRIYRIGM